MTRIRPIALVLAVITLIAAVPPPQAAAQLVFDAFPASALVRGENVWLRLDPAADTEVVDFLQRGDPITITGESVFDGDDEYYPVDADLTGESGWIAVLFIDPRSIAGTSDVVVPVEEIDVPAEEVDAGDDAGGQRQQNRQDRRQDRQADAAQEPEQEVAPAAEEPANDRAARRAARQADQDAAVAEEEQPADDQAARRAARQAERAGNAGGANASGDELTFSGEEPTVTPEFTAPSDVLTVTASHDGDGNFIVLAVSPEGTEDFLFNEIGPFSGETTLEIAEGSTVVFDIDANGPWELVVTPAF